MIIRSAAAVLLIAHLCHASATAGELPSKRIDVPGGGMLIYYYDDEVSGDVVAIEFGGDGCGEWLASQKDERSHWHKLPSLEEIHLTYAELHREEIEYIASLKNVMTLRMDQVFLHGDALDPLEQMIWLRRLEVFHHVAGEHRGLFEFLDKLASLEILILGGSFDEGARIDEGTWVRVCELKRLKWLDLWPLGDISRDKLALVENLSRLENLYLRPFAEFEDPTPLLQGLCGHQHLKTLDLSAKRFDSADVECLASIKTLETLWLSGKAIGRLSPLGNLTNLKRLRLSFREYQEPDGFRFLAATQQLKELHLTSNTEVDFPIEIFRGYPCLEDLKISTTLSEEDISVLESLPKLKTLTVRNPTGSAWYRTAKHRLPEVKFGSEKVSGTFLTEE